MDSGGSGDLILLKGGGTLAVRRTSTIYTHLKMFRISQATVVISGLQLLYLKTMCYRLSNVHGLDATFAIISEIFEPILLSTHVKRPIGRYHHRYQLDSTCLSLLKERWMDCILRLRSCCAG